MQDENNTSCRLLTTEITGCLKLTTTGPHFMAGLIMKEKNALCANIRKSRVVVCVFFVWALQLELLFSRLWPACDCSGRRRKVHRMSTWRCRLCWVQKPYTGWTTSLRDDLQLVWIGIKIWPIKNGACFLPDGACPTADRSRTMAQKRARTCQLLNAPL